MTLGSNFPFLSLSLSFSLPPACFLRLSHSLKTVFDYFSSNYLFHANVTSAVAAEEWKGEGNQIITAKTIVLPATQPCLHQIWGMALPSYEGHIEYLINGMCHIDRVWNRELWTKVPRKKVHLQICKTDQLELQWPWSSWNIIGPESNCNLCWVLFSSLNSHSFPSLCGPNILWITGKNLLEDIRELQLPRLKGWVSAYGLWPTDSTALLCCSTYLMFLLMHLQSVLCSVTVHCFRPGTWNLTPCLSSQAMFTHIAPE